MHDPNHHTSTRSEQRDVTLLFADLRGFTELAESIEVEPLVCELLAHVMDCLTEAVLQHDGTVVDYYGDGLVAMWNAPAEQPAHAEFACRAGLRMLESLPDVAADWMSVIQSELRLGIGVHTGSVQVGNAGSKHQAKYGPRGPNVNLASRVEAATKELRVPFVATQATVERLTDEFAAHRVCRARLPGFDQPMDLFAVRDAQRDANLSQAWAAYDAALRHFEENRFCEAADVLAAIDSSVTEVPTVFLIERVEQELGRQQRRRSSDKPAVVSNGVIALTAK